MVITCSQVYTSGMTDSDNEATDSDVLRANINNETSQINWSELQRFFAGGWLIYVSSESNLLDVAVAFSQDDKDKVSKWLTSGEVAKVSDDQAKQWHTEDTAFWSTVVKPWVLIQPSKDSDTAPSDQAPIH
jgi:hypothetical protein